MNETTGNTPPVFESDEEYQEWLKGEKTEFTEQYNREFSDGDPPEFESDEAYESFLRGEK